MPIPRRLIMLFAAALLPACTPKILQQEITPPLSAYSAMKPNPALTHSVAVAQVTVAPAAGGNDGLVSAASFSGALQNSLALVGYYANGADKPAYALDASLDKVDADSFGITMKTATTASYVLRRQSDNAVVFRSTVDASAASGWSDSMSGAIRSRDSIINAVSSNITQLIGQLSQSELSVLPPIAPTPIPVMPALPAAPLVVAPAGRHGVVP